ncbi:AarF/ABC1/UbiB kinase family protein [Pseudenhygromyxa sp. WMMC2535]|uniref:AarF/UbiB family protein n=1 Tax=Pseudenhygromyxa sp. WMMC2535 TaxID=2712867 RepID=UPI0015536432|nr:AarF/ABC1/UbiB kinase family protein [Pseudenhygromyxa sp. WMMC2535]
MSVLRTIVHSSRALVTTAKDAVRFREIAQVFITHGFGWVVAQLRLRRELQIEHDGEDLGRAALNSPDTGKRLVKALTLLGPTWVKFGQILSTRHDALPPSIVSELQSLQDDVEHVDIEDIHAQLERNLGKDWRAHFESFEDEPLASASIGQVHQAVLGDGTKVVLKIQRPGIGPTIESDVNILHTIAGYLEEAFEEAHIMDLRGMVRDFAKSLSQELDYQVESNNMERFRRNFAASEDVRIPAVFKALSTSQVLTMEFIEGKKFDVVIDEGEAPDELVRRYFNVAYKMLFIDGFFHGDLHPGNVLLTPDGRLGLLDCGMVGRLAPSRRDKVIDIIHAVINEDLEALARTFFQLAIPQGHVDYPAFEADAIAIAEQYLLGVPLAQIQIGELFQQLVGGAARHKVRMPTDFTMMFKAIITTEGLAKAIAPDVDPIELARPFITQMITERYSPERLKQQATRDLIAFSGMARTIPNTIPVLLDELGGGRMKFGVAPETLALQHKAADLRVGRAIRAALSIALLICGTAVIGVAGLPIALWGIPWLTICFWGAALLLNATLLRRKNILPQD